MSQVLKRTICRESGYECSQCRRFGVEIHHIIPWREAILLYKDAHYESNLIALCPICHKAADIGDISRDQLRRLKRGSQLPSPAQFPIGTVLSLLSEGRRTYPDDLAFWQDVCDLSKGLFLNQRIEFLKDLYRKMRDVGQLESAAGVALLHSLGSLLRRRSSKCFSEATKLLKLGIGIERTLHKSDRPGPYMGKLTYELAYIDFLQGAFAASRQLALESAAAEEGQGNPDGARISRVFADSILMHAGFLDMDRAFVDALRFFERRDSSKAGVWSCYCREYLVEAETARCLRERKRSTKLFECLHRQLNANQDFYDAHSIQVGPELPRRRAMLFFLQGEYEEASRHLGVALLRHKNLHCEGLAETRYLCGLVAEHRGKLDEASENYRIGSGCDPRMGNCTFVSRCIWRFAKCELPR